MDTNYRWHREALAVVGSLLEERFCSSPEREDAEGVEADNDEQRAHDGSSIQLQADVLSWLLVPNVADVDHCLPLQHAKLGAAISAAIKKGGQAKDVRFTQEEWDGFSLLDVPEHSYIQVEGHYFKAGAPLERQLIDFSRLVRMSEVGGALVCRRQLDNNSELACIDGKCQYCGFQQLWSRGLRRRLHAKDHGSSGICGGPDSMLWSQPMSWCALLECLCAIHNKC